MVSELFGCFSCISENRTCSTRVLIYMLLLQKQLKHTMSAIFLHFDTICSSTEEITCKINFPAIFSNLEKVCIFVRDVNECRNCYSNIRIGYSNIFEYSNDIHIYLSNRPITMTYLVVHVLKI